MAQAHVGLEKPHQYRQQAKLDRVCVRRNVHRFFPCQLSILAESCINRRRILRRGRDAHLRKERIVKRLMAIEISSRVVGAVKKAQKHQGQPARQ